MVYYITAPPEDTDYLIHYGTPRHSGRYPFGSGARPYQSIGGASTKRGKKKETSSAYVRATGSKKKDKQDALFERTEKNGKDRANISPAEAATKEVKKAADSAKDVLTAAEKLKKNGKNKSESPAKQMSDDELKKVINRLELERRYDSLSSNDVYDGWEKAEDVLSIIGGVVGIVGGVAGAYAILKSV